MNVEYDTINGLRFVGRYGGYKDDDTDLTYFWHRWYDERDGRWVSRDPIQIMIICNRIEFNDVGFLPAYLYVHNTPIVYIDINGLFGTTDCSYYEKRCDETKNVYYCKIAPFACNIFGDWKWSNCVRQCLQDLDRQIPLIDKCGKVNILAPIEEHVFCYILCGFSPKEPY